MENAAEALKMAFAVLVFVIAMSLGFMMISQARATADVVYMATDKQDYVDNITAMTDTGESARIVGLDTVIPTIYRYAQENYAVTIIDGNTIKARFDLQTENIVSSEFPNTTQPNGGENYQNLLNTDSSDDIIGISECINMATGKNVLVNDQLFKNLYKIVDSTKPFAPWTSSTYKIMQRLKVDIGGGSSIFFNTNPDGTKTNKYNGVFSANGLRETYKDKKFEEYYYTIEGKNPLTNEDQVEKLEIIYVVN